MRKVFFLFVEYLFQIFRPKFETLFKKNWAIGFLFFNFIIDFSYANNRVPFNDSVKKKKQKQKAASDHVSVNFDNE